MRIILTKLNRQISIRIERSIQKAILQLHAHVFLRFLFYFFVDLTNFATDFRPWVCRTIGVAAIEQNAYVNSLILSASVRCCRPWFRYHECVKRPLSYSVLHPKSCWNQSPCPTGRPWQGGSEIFSNFVGSTIGYRAQYWEFDLSSRRRVLLKRPAMFARAPSSEKKRYAQ